MIRRTHFALFVVSSLVMAGESDASESSETKEDALLGVEGDVEYGEYLSSQCTSCHQASGANDGIPSIVGWKEETFRLVMHDYRTAFREHPAMNMIAGRLTDEEVAALSAYFATLEDTSNNKN